MPTTVNSVNDIVLTAVGAQLSDLRPVVGEQAELADLYGKLSTLLAMMDGAHGIPLDGSLTAVLQTPTPVETGVLNRLKPLVEGNGSISDLGGILISLYALQQHLRMQTVDWLTAGTATPTDAASVVDAVTSAIVQVRRLLKYRPDVGAIMDDLSAVKSLSGGPADVVAFHDFNVLQLAFRSVWMHAFNDNLAVAAGRLYEQTVMQLEPAAAA